MLLPLWREYGTGMFPMLDAEFALVIYDAATQGFIAARDPIGIRPLFYGYDKNGAIMFASEAINLVGLSDHIMPFPPGCYWKDGEFVRYCDIAAPHGSVIGGLGSAVAETLARRAPTPCEFVGVRDRFGKSGEFEQLLGYFGLDAAAVVEAVKKLIA